MSFILYLVTKCCARYYHMTSNTGQAWGLMELPVCLGSSEFMDFLRRVRQVRILNPAWLSQRQREPNWGEKGNSVTQEGQREYYLMTKLDSELNPVIFLRCKHLWQWERGREGERNVLLNLPGQRELGSSRGRGTSPSVPPGGPHTHAGTGVRAHASRQGTLHVMRKARR